MTFIRYNLLHDIPKELRDGASLATNGGHVVNVVSQHRLDESRQKNMRLIQDAEYLKSVVRNLIVAVNEPQNTVCFPQPIPSASEWCVENSTEDYTIVLNETSCGFIGYFSNQRDAALFKLFFS